MMTYDDEGNTFSKLLTNGEEPINVYTQLTKTLFGLQKQHTLPALGLAAFERYQTPHKELFIKRSKELRKQIKDILGLFSSIPNFSFKI
jgi:hypothetical protein